MSKNVKNTWRYQKYQDIRNVKKYVGNVCLITIINNWRDARGVQRFTVEANIFGTAGLVDATQQDGQSKSDCVEMEVDQDAQVESVDSLT